MLAVVPTRCSHGIIEWRLAETLVSCVPSAEKDMPHHALELVLSLSSALLGGA
jgi:hypothetical protein